MSTDERVLKVTVMVLVINANMPLIRVIKVQVLEDLEFFGVGPRR